MPPPKRTPSPKLTVPRGFMRVQGVQPKRKLPRLSGGRGSGIWEAIGGIRPPDPLADAFRDGNLVGSENEITDFDGTSFSGGHNGISGGGAGGGAGGNLLSGNKLRAFEELTKPTRRLGRKKSEKGPGPSRVY